MATVKKKGVKITFVGGVSLNHHSGDFEGCNGVNKITGLEGHKEPCNGSPGCGFQSQNYQGHLGWGSDVPERVGTAEGNTLRASLRSQRAKVCHVAFVATGRPSPLTKLSTLVSQKAHVQPPGNLSPILVNHSGILLDLVENPTTLGVAPPFEQKGLRKIQGQH